MLWGTSQNGVRRRCANTNIKSCAERQGPREENNFRLMIADFRFLKSSIIAHKSEIKTGAY